MTTIDKSKPVLVTGATGYVAGWLVKKLLDEGFTVHAAVRSPNNKDSVNHLIQLEQKSKGALKLYKADLLDEGSYDNAMKDCEVVFHTASPFINKVGNPKRDLVDPALLGTSNVLESANRTESVKRVVLTSSVAAIIGDAADCQLYPKGVATEEQWNFSSTIDHQPYSYSKTLAERKAWEIAGKQKRWDLVVINPSLVIGPGIKPAFNSESFRIIKQLGDGTSRLGVPSFSIGVVDVRDLAEAHYKAGFLPEANGRHIISAKESSLLSLSQILADRFGNDFQFASGTLPRTIVLLMAPLVGFKRKMMSRNIGYPWRADNSKGVKALGMNYRPVEDSITEMFQQMLDSGLVKDRRRK
jgi:nucleoside-diphosphate-sugar epimerase